MIEPGRDYGVKGSSADVADGLGSFLLFFCASKVMLALSSQAYGWPVPDLSRRELIPNEDTASDRFLSVQDWPRQEGESEAGPERHAFTRLAWSTQTAPVQLGPYTIVGDPSLLQSARPLGEIGKAGATSAS